MSHRLALALALIAAAPAAAADAARVVAVADGDTLAVTREGVRIKVRLASIDAPELGQPGGEEARRCLETLATGRDVEVRERGRDRYGRTLAEVILADGTSLNHELVRRGWAWWYRRYAARDAGLAGSEAEARSAGVGLWGLPLPVPPWEWRRGVGGSGVVANVRSGLYHRPGCRGGSAIALGNRLAFGAKAEAEERGFKAAGDCGR